MTNSIRDRNRFNLAPPPAWWLQKLREFDASLVVIPSRMEALYYIAQRRPMAEMAQGQDQITIDEVMLRQYGLVKVTKLLSLTGAYNWNDSIFPHLALRAGWRHGLTPAQAAHLADQRDADEVTARHAARDDRLLSQLRWSETVAKWHTGNKILVTDPARLAQRAPSEPSGWTGAPATQP